MEKVAENTPAVSSFRLVLAIFGSSLTASHPSASLSDTGLMAGTTSGECTTTTLVRSTLGMAGTGGISSTPLSDVGLFALGVKGGVGVSWDGLA